MAAEATDAALEVLLSLFDDGTLAWPAAGGALFLRAREGAALARAPRPGLICEQSFAPEANALRRAGRTLREAYPTHGDDGDGDGGDGDEAQRYPLVLALPPRQREEARALLARAVAQCTEGGVVVACTTNDEGAKSGEADMKALAGLSGTRSKHHCRAYWTTVRRTPPSTAVDVDAHTVETQTVETQTVDRALSSTWASLDAPRPIAEGRFLSRPGVFAWDRIDAASALLAASLPDDLRGRAADLGAGYGYLSVELLQRCPGIVAVDLYEAEARALALAERNLAPFASRAALEFHWCDVVEGLRGRYDAIVANPPFHAQSRADRPDIGRAFIAVAADALEPGGRLWLVANRHLPYESVLDARFGTVRTAAQAQGFKVIEATKASANRGAARSARAARAARTGSTRA
ncbi:MAG: 16S rRNA methyltransferase [Lysobacter sp.]|nr:MAG: 16S rRNA methyltransferase [Lysobacter sp.]